MFFQTSLRLEEIEVLLTGADPGSDQSALADRHARLSQSIVESSIAALHVGRSLLGRVGRDDAAGDGVNKKVRVFPNCRKYIIYKAYYHALCFVLFYK